MTPEDLSLLLLHSVESQDLSKAARYESLYRGHVHDVELRIREYPFNRFENWGLSTTEPAQADFEQNWFVNDYSQDELLDFRERASSVDSEELVKFLRQICADRYREDLLSVYIFGGYLYGVTPGPGDLDVALVVGGSSALENDINIEWPNLESVVSYPRKPNNRVGMSVVSASHINPLTRNSTVLRTGVITTTTGLRMFGRDYQTTPVPAAIMLYHALEMVTWGFKGLFDESRDSHVRSLWRLTEAGFILRYLSKIIGSPLPSGGQWPRELRKQMVEYASGTSSLHTEFVNIAETFREDLNLMRGVMRRQALDLLRTVVN